MAVEVKGQYFLDVKIGGKPLNFDAVHELLIIEEAGNFFPTFKLDMELAEYEILKDKLHYDSKIDIYLGPTRDASMRSSFRMTRIEDYPGAKDPRQHIIRLTGVYDGYDKYFHSRVLLSDDNSSLDVIKTLVSLYLGTTAIFRGTTSDEMKWISWGLSPRAFIDHLWLHGYNEGSLFVPTITMDGVFRMYDIIDVLNSGSPKLRLVPVEAQFDDPRKFMYNQPRIVDSSGLLNSWMGGGREIDQWDLKEGDHTQISPNDDKGSTKQQSDFGVFEKRFPQVHYDPDNVHENFHKAHTTNLRNLAKFSRSQVSVVLPGRITAGDTRPVLAPLDKVLFTLENPDGDKAIDGQADPYFSGEYVVSKIHRAYVNQAYNERIYCCREGHGYL